MDIAQLVGDQDGVVPDTAELGVDLLTMWDNSHGPYKEPIHRPRKTQNF